VAEQNPRSDKNIGGTVKQIALAFQLPFTMAGPPVVGGAAGYFLDRWLHTAPFLMIVLGILGVVIGILDAIKTASAEEKNSRE